jgi:hypothetical protein
MVSSFLPPQGHSARPPIPHGDHRAIPFDKFEDHFQILTLSTRWHRRQTQPKPDQYSQQCLQSKNPPPTLSTQISLKPAHPIELRRSMTPGTGTLTGSPFGRGPMGHLGLLSRPENLLITPQPRGPRGFPLHEQGRFVLSHPGHICQDRISSVEVSLKLMQMLEALNSSIQRGFDVPIFHH